MKTLAKILLATAAVAALAVPANAAGTQSTTFTVTASVAATCSIGVTNIAFGNYTGTQIDVTSTNGLSVNCVSGTGYSVTLSNGANYNTTRRMANGTTNFIGYNLYTDSTYATVWGGTTTGPTTGATGNGAAQTYNMYARAFGGPVGISGTYTDTVTATVTY